MISNEPVRGAEGEERRVASRFGVAVVIAGVFAACTGDNTFTGLGFAGPQRPEVTITAPQANISIAAGDSVEVKATITSVQGVSQVTFTSLLDGGGNAFTPISVTLPNPQDTTLARFMIRATATAGSARIIVRAVDVLGDDGADTVAVSLGG
jgi:hypothetical protein